MKKTIFTHLPFCSGFSKLFTKGVFLTTLLTIGVFSAQAQCPPYHVTSGVHFFIETPGLICGELSPNVLNNPGFEQGLPGPVVSTIAPFPAEPNGWTIFGGEGGIQNVFLENPSANPDANPLSGAQHISVKSSENTGASNTSGFYQDHPTVPGDIWSGSIQVMSPSSAPLTGNEQFFLMFLDASGCTLPGEGYRVNRTVSNSSPTDEYFKFTIIAEAPPSAVSVRYLVVLFEQGMDVGTVYYDDASLQKLETPIAPIIEVTANPGDCGVELEFPEFFREDQAIVSSFRNDFNNTDDPSDFYPIGQHTVTVTVEDNFGNTNSCSFQVWVNEFPNPLTTLACNDFIIIGLDDDGEALLTADLVLEGGPYKCYDEFEIDLEDNNGDPVNNPLDCNDIGETFKVIVTDPDTENSCWGEVTVEDKQPPFLNCVNRTLPCASTINSAPKPSASDNCDNNPTEQLVDQVLIDGDPCDNDTVAYVRTWVAFDDYGNQTTPCNDTIYIVRPTAVDFPNDIIWFCDQYNIDHDIVDPVKLHNSISDQDQSDPDIDVRRNLSFSIIKNTGSGVPSAIDNLSGSVVLDGEHCQYGYTSSDEFLATCNGNSNSSTFKIVRTWTVLDWCTGAVIMEGFDDENNNGTQDGANEETEDNEQIIKVIDDVPPVINPSDVTVSVNIPGEHPTPCLSRGKIPLPSVSDNCSGVASVKILTPIGQTSSNGTIPSPGLEIGTYTINYTVEDRCGNVSNATSILTIIDDTSPSVICDEITEVDLSSDGMAEVPAAVFDDGSFDNCCMDAFSVAKMDDFCGNPDDLEFGETVTFCCGDVANSPVTVAFRVTDCYGHSNQCMVQVYVEDKQNPVLVSCPPNQTILCDFYSENLESALDLEDYSVLDQFGAPEYADNCDLDIQVNINENIDQCDQGTISRSWQATDQAGNTPTSCSQTIFVRHVSDWVVQFPADLTVTCTDEVPDFGEPEVFFETCELIAVSYEDQLFDIVPDACFKLVRHWTVINWCVVGADVDQEVIEIPEQQMPLQFNDIDGDGIPWEPRVYRDSWNGINFPGAADAGSNGPPDTDVDLDPWDGYIEYEQTIKVIDTVNPIFTNDCAVPNICIEDNTCGATVLFEAPEVQDCSEDVTITVTSDFGAGYGPFFNIAPGTYSVIFSATDNCGNSESCETTFSVSDCKLPTPYCNNGLVIEIMPVDPPMVEIWASDYDAGSFDNCPGDVILSFSSDVTNQSTTFDCNDLGTQLVEIWVTDAAGNQDFCQSVIVIQDNNLACLIDDPHVQMGGLITNEEDESIKDVEVNLSGSDDLMAMTGSDGLFVFPEVTEGGDYTIIPIKDVEPLNGVSTFDLVLMSKHILGTQKLDSPYKIIAADANKSGTITTFDMVEVRRLILFVIDDFTNNTSWRFIDKDFEFPNPENPFETGFYEVQNFNNVDIDELAADFIGVKIGDVNNSANPSQLLGGDDRNAFGTLTFSTNDRSVKVGETVTIDFVASELDVFGYQFSLNFDKNALDFVEVGNGLASNDHFGLNLLDEGVITASWSTGKAQSLQNTEAVFSLTFTAKTEAQLSDLININSRYTAAEAYNANLELLDVALEFNGANTTSQFKLYQNTPNPFSTDTKVGFELPEATQVKLTISDLSGKVLQVIEQEFNQGYNEVVLHKKDLNTNGVLYLQLETATETATRKMVLIK